jgi:hypothetical protein
LQSGAKHFTIAHARPQPQESKMDKKIDWLQDTSFSVAINLGWATAYISNEEIIVTMKRSSEDKKAGALPYSIKTNKIVGRTVIKPR